MPCMKSQFLSHFLLLFENKSYSKPSMVMVTTELEDADIIHFFLKSEIMEINHQGTLMKQHMTVKTNIHDEMQQKL